MQKSKFYKRQNQNMKKDISNKVYRYFITYSYNDQHRQLHYSSCIIKVNNKIKSNTDLKHIQKKLLLIDDCLNDALCEMFSSYDTVQNLNYGEKIKFLSLAILNIKLIND